MNNISPYPSAIIRTQSMDVITRLEIIGLKMTKPLVTKGNYPNGIACFSNGTFCRVSLDNTMGEWNRFTDCGTDENRLFFLIKESQKK